jgi:hypothetical protein
MEVWDFFISNAVWTFPLAIVVLDTVFHLLPVPYQGRLKKLYDYAMEKLNRK